MIGPQGLKIGPAGSEPSPLPQGIEIGEKLLWKCKETQYTTKPTMSKKFYLHPLIPVLGLNSLRLGTKLITLQRLHF